MILPQLPIPGNLHPMPVSMPVGAVIAFAGKITDPVDPDKQPDYTTVVESQGWLVCNGKTVRIADYSMLYAVIGAQYNTGKEKEEEFSIPDYRGYFLRMVTMDTKNDPDAKERKLPDKRKSDEVGSIQEDALQWHQHKYDRPGKPVSPAGDKGANAVIEVKEDLTKEPTDIMDDKENTVRCSTETRAKNIYVYYLIKFTI